MRGFLKFIPVLAVLLVFLLSSLLLLSSCRTPGIAVIEEPSFPLPEIYLDFTGISAENPDDLFLDFTLKIFNYFPIDIPVNINSYTVSVNGNIAESGFELINYQNISFTVDAVTQTESDPSTAEVDFILAMNVPVLVRNGLAPHDDYEILLTLELVTPIPLPNNYSLEVSALAEFPGVRAPSFSITSIAILQAELINTGFRVGIVIDNPNPFPVNLAAFNYTLYGNDMLWADGRERNIISVAAKTALSGNIFLVMNFIDMNRFLLDQIINLVDVNYRFTGEAVVHTGVEYLPSFVSGFDLTGYSIVIPE